MDKKDKVVLWQDVVSIRDLILALVIALVATMGMYFLAPADDNTKKLLFGLAGSVIGVVVNSLVFKPKRRVEVEK